MFDYEAIEKHLRADLGVTKIAGQKSYYATAPNKTPAPYDVFYLISDPPENRRLGIPSLRYQFSAFGKSPGEARALAKAIINAFQGFQGYMGGAGGLPVKQTVYMGGLIDLQDTNAGLFYCPVDFKITFEE